MGLMDKVKSQATQLAEKAQQAGQAGQAKIAELQSKRKADAMLLELGGLTYKEKTGQADPAGGSRAAELVDMLRSHETEHGSIVVTSANAAIAETTGVLDPNATMPSPGQAPPTSSAGPIPQAQYGSDETA